MRLQFSRTVPRLILSGAVALAGQLVTALPVAAQTYPGNSVSYYMTSHDGQAAYNAGCTLGHAATNGSRPSSERIIMSFGAPGYVTNGSGQITSYGAWFYLPGSGYQTTSVIANVVENFGAGFWACSSYTPTLMIAAGVTSEASLIAGHGTAWAQMVNQINAYFVAHQYSGQVSARGALDAENETGWATYTADKAWADAYSSAGSYLYFDYGDAGGCSTTSYNNSVFCNLSWKQSMFYYLSWGALLAVPFPEIYATSGANASQWKMIVLYAYAYGGATSMDISASLTQYAACSQKGGCSGTNNTASAGWTQLYNALNSDSRSAQSLYWASDIRYGY
jgi:hypothetical protein